MTRRSWLGWLAKSPAAWFAAGSGAAIMARVPALSAASLRIFGPLTRGAYRLKEAPLKWQDGWSYVPLAQPSTPGASWSVAIRDAMGRPVGVLDEAAKFWQWSR